MKLLSLSAALAGTLVAVSAADSSVNCDMDVQTYTNTTCSAFAKQWNLDPAAFQAINPSLTTCPTLGLGTYCVVGSVDDGKGTTTIAPSQASNATTPISFITGAPKSTTIPPSVTPTPSGSTPVMTGVPSDCSSYYRVVKGDTCSWIAQAHGISLDQFYNWNPSIGYGCSNVIAGYYYCVLVPGASTTSTWDAVTTPGHNRPTVTVSSS